MTLEQVMIALGVDASQVAAGLRSVEDKFNEFGHKVTDNLKDAMKEWLAPLAGAGLVVALDRLGEFVKRIKASAEAMSASTDFVQTLENAGKAAGVAGERIESMMGKFIKTLPAGSDVETEIYKFADGLAAIPDPADRATLAFEKFGKGGTEMIKILMHGKAGVEALAAGFGHLTEAEINQLELVQRRVEQAQSWGQRVLGRIVATGSATLEGAFRFGAFGGMVSPAEIGREMRRNDQRSLDEEKASQKDYAAAQLEEDKQKMQKAYNDMLDEEILKNGKIGEQEAVLNRRITEGRKIAEAARKSNDLATWVEASKRVVEDQNHLKKIQDEWMDKWNEGFDKAADADQKRLRHAERIKQIENEILQARLSQEQSAIEGAVHRYGRFTPSLEQYAQSGYFSSFNNNGPRVFHQGPLAGIAQRMLALQNYAQQALLSGNPDEHKAAIDQYDQLHAKMVSGGFLTPDMQLESGMAQIKMANHIEALINHKEFLMIGVEDDADGN